MPRRSAHSTDPGRPLSAVVRPESTHLRAATITERGGVRPTYRFSDKSITLLRLLTQSTESERAERAWAVIGPYGAGKSSFGQLLVSLLASSDYWAREALQNLEQVDAQLSEQVARLSDRYLAVTALGSADGLERALLSAIDDTLASAAPRSRERRRVRDAMTAAGHGAAIEAIHDALVVAARTHKAGVFLIVDEFGRFLDGDHQEASRTLALIQDLAELANRSTGPQLHVVVMLHQNFDDYAASLARSRRNEWAKVQGRFRQFSFQEDPSALYESIASSIQIAEEANEAIGAWAELVLDEVRELAPFMGQDFWTDLVRRTYPLHPLATFALPRLGALLGQNERSLFAFMGSSEPRSLRTFLESQLFDAGALPTLRLDGLYDYFMRGQAGAALPSRTRRSIALAQSALEQLDDGDGVATQVVKTLAVLSPIADRSFLKPTGACLRAATGLRADGLEHVLEKLTADNVLLWREHSQQYVLNPGTDFDIESAIEYAITELGPDLDVPAVIEDALHVKSIVARRHSLERGTARVFQPTFVSDVVPESRVEHWSEINVRPDGVIRFVLAGDPGELERSRNAAEAVSDPLTITVVPDAPIPCVELAREYRAIKTVMGQSVIAADRVARAELELRLGEVRDAIARTVAPLLNPGHSWWYQGGLPPFQPQSARDVQRLLSSVCDDVFERSPSINNELVNRRKLSSSVVVAVKKILSELLAGTSDEGLGLDGNRPEVSVFRSLFQDSGWYSQVEGVWRIRRPSQRAGNWHSLWHEIESFLGECEREPHTLSELWDRLARPPFGLRAGVMPILTMAVFIANRDRVCLFENGTYLPRWSTEHYDRIVRFPGSFTIRSLVLDGAEGEALQRMTRALPVAEVAPVETDGAALNTFLSRLFGWYRVLPDYSRKTQRLSPSARQLRAALMTTPDPVALVLQRIPDALGLPPITGRTPELVLDQLEVSLAEAAGEVAAAYPRLLDELVSVQASVLGVSTSWPGVRQRYTKLAAMLRGYRLSDAAAVVLLRGADSSLPDAEWCESVGAAVVGQAPKHWSEGDVRLCEQKLPELVHEIVEAADARVRLARRQGDTAVRGYRVLVQSSDGSDYEVVSSGGSFTSPDDETCLVIATVEQALDALPLGLRRDLLAHLMQRATEPQEETDG